MNPNEGQQGAPGYPPPPQQPGAYPPPPPAYPPQAAATPNRWGPTSLGMDANVAAGLSYIAIVGLIFFFIEKTNRFVRFHAAQSILLAIASIAVWIVFSIIDSIIFGAAVAANTTGAATAGLGVATLFGCIGFLLGLAIFGLFIWGLIAGFTGRFIKFPIIGDIAERWAGGPPAPAF